MHVRCRALIGLPLVALLGACNNDTTSIGLPTGSIDAPAAEADTIRGTLAVPGRPARVYVMAGLNADCSSTGTPGIDITVQPTKGAVSFHPRQATTIQFSKSGNCIGQRALGTGIYYTARAGETGTDTFSILARTGSDAPVAQTFQVKIDDR